METKIIPFNLETAKKIQEGKIKGKIKTRCGYDARILCTDLIGQAQPVLVAFLEGNSESVTHYTKRGQFYINGKSHEYDLIIEVPDNEPQFKPFDKVLVREQSTDEWKCDYFSHAQNDGVCTYYVCVGGEFLKCIPYEGNQELIGTTDKPKDD